MQNLDGVMLESFRHITNYRVPFADLDYMQHVNHLAYIRWAETTRSEYFVDVLGEKVNGERGIILVRADFSYERQLGFRERVAIGTRISRVGTRSFDYVYEIFSEDAQVRSAFGTTTMVAYDYVQRESIAVPQEWREKVAAFEALLPEGLTTAS